MWHICFRPLLQLASMHNSSTEIEYPRHMTYTLCIPAKDTLAHGLVVCRTTLHLSLAQSWIPRGPVGNEWMACNLHDLRLCIDGLQGMRNGNEETDIQTARQTDRRRQRDGDTERDRDWWRGIVSVAFNDVYTRTTTSLLIIISASLTRSQWTVLSGLVNDARASTNAKRTFLHS